MNKIEFEAFLAACRWTTAKTMPKNPHQWMQRRDVDDQTFVNAVNFLRDNGYAKRFGPREYICYDVGPHRYWTMGSPMWDTRLINRAVN